MPSYLGIEGCLFPIEILELCYRCISSIYTTIIMWGVKPQQSVIEMDILEPSSRRRLVTIAT